MRIYCTIFLLLISFALFGQTPSDFVGTWRVDVEESINRMDPKTKAKFDSLAENYRVKIKEIFNGLQIVFKADKTFVTNSFKNNQFSTQNGTWATEDGTSNLIFDWGSKIEHFKYRFLNVNVMLLNTPDSDWFRETYLTKN